MLQQTSAYGHAFEHFVILEAHKLHAAREKDFRFFYFESKDDLEIDLVVERPGLPLLLIEIKSATIIQHEMLQNLEKVASHFEGAVCYCLCRERVRRRIGRVEVVHWQEGLKEIFWS